MPIEKWITLGTKERSVALERLPAARCELMEFFQRGGIAQKLSSGIVPSFRGAERPSHPELPLLTNADAQRLARDYFQAELSELDAVSADLITFSPDQREQWLFELTDRLAALTHGKPDEEDPALGIEISLLRAAGKRASYQSEPSRLLRGYIRRALAQLWRIELDRARGDFCDAITDRMFVPTVCPPNAPSSHSSVLASSSIPLETLITEFDREFIEGEEITAKTANKNRAALSVIQRYFGADADVARIDFEAMTAFRDTLAALPPNVTKKFGKEADLGQIAQANIEAGGPFLNRETQATYLRLLGSLFDYARKRRYVSFNDAMDLRPKGKSTPAQARRRPFAHEQLRTIFTAPIYTGCVDDERGYAKPGPNRPRRSRFWVPLLGLFTGLRMEEILQLTPEHVQLDRNGEPFLHITPGMKVKTDNAFREVPIHRDLLRLGFMSFVMARREEGLHQLLFDDVPVASDGHRSTNFSKRFATFLGSLGIKEDERRTCFHSFRHNFRDGLRQPDANPDFVREAGGWAMRETSDFYGDGTKAHLLRDLIDGIDYDLDLRHLHLP